MTDDDLSYAEVSQVLDMPVGSIGPTRARCLACLRRTVAADAGG
jgi:DNA-directed RNA polymerase specialized sigma24 family protein